MLPVKPETCTHLKHLKSMVRHRLSCFSYIFFLANSTCWLLIHFFYYSFIIFFTGQLNVLAYLSFFYFFIYWPTQRVGLSQYSRMDLIGSCYSLSHMLGKYFLRCWPLTATGNLTPSNSSSMNAFPGKTWSTFTARAKLETTCHIFYLWFPAVTLPPKLNLQPGILSAWPFCYMHEQL